MPITFDQIKENKTIQTYIEMADHSLQALGYTEHSFPHVNHTATVAGKLMRANGRSKREIELARIAGYMHDIGNIVNRVDHAQSGAILAFQILDKLGMDPAEIAQIVSAIGNHDEETAQPVSAIAAALILADKCDVRRSRVRNRDLVNFDIHDRVNYAVTNSHLWFSDTSDEIVLELKIDTEISPILSYFEIFLKRMILSAKAARFYGKSFGLIINKQRLL